MTGNKHLYIVFSRSNTILSRLIHLTKRCRYTHAALALDEDLSWMYSFGRKNPSNPFVGAFRREGVHEGVYALQQELPGAVLRLSVTEEQYDMVRETILSFVRERDKYGYNYKVLLRNLFGSSLRSEDAARVGGENRFVCSEFVYHVLEQSGIAKWRVRRESVLPEHLLKLDGEILFEGDLKKYRTHKRLELVPFVGAVSARRKAAGF